MGLTKTLSKQTPDFCPVLPFSADSSKMRGNRTVWVFAANPHKKNNVMASQLRTGPEKNILELCLHMHQNTALKMQ